MRPNGHPYLPPDPSMPKRKPPSLDDGRPPRNRAPPVELGAVLRAATGFEPSAIGFEPSSSAHGADVIDCDGLPWPAYVATNAGRYRTRLDTMRRGSGRGARPLQDTERLEHGGYGARVVFGAQLIEYDNGLDYAARLSKPAYFEGYTTIPLGNAPWSVCRRWANGMLKGAREGGRGKGLGFEPCAEQQEAANNPGRPAWHKPRDLGFEPCTPKKK